MNQDKADEVLSGYNRERYIPALRDLPDQKGRSDAPSRRHFVKANRVEVIGDPDGLLRGTWLPLDEAERMLEEGDFYSNGTRLRIVIGSRSQEATVRIKHQKTHLETQTGLHQFQGNIPKTLDKS